MDLRHRFGRVEVRPVEREVVVDGAPVALGSRAFDLLLTLIDHRDRLITKNELLDLVWPGLVVEENNLAVQISSLRKALGAHTIVTVPGRGYRFAAQLATPSPSAASAAPSAQRALPAPPISLWGRDGDCAALDELLAHGRLVTLVGAGGIGKTTLALAVAHARREDYRDGVAWVNLTDIHDSSLVARAVAQAAGLPAVVAQDPLPALVSALGPLQMLLVLDNAEHLVDGVLRLTEAILAQAPGVKVLVTSQAAVKADGERLFRLGPLSVPAAGASSAEAGRHGAIALFADQARAIDRQFVLSDDNVASVIDLCQRLDGVALAIKLAAARLPLFGLAGLAARLGDRLKLLGNGPKSAPARQQTLHAALEWSHGLLNAEAKRVLRRLSVFANGFNVELVGEVAGDAAMDAWLVIDALGELVDRSLVEVEGGDRVRYRLLETTRAYARLQLDQAGERDATLERHAEAMASLADDAYESYWRSADLAWLDAFEPELDNFRTAIDWSAEHRPDLALRLAASSSLVFLLTGQAPEARRRQAGVEAAANRAGTSPAACRYWLERSRLHWGISSDLMHEYAQRALASCRETLDTRGQYLALRCAAASGAMEAAQARVMVDEMTALECPEWPPRLRTQRLLAEMAVLSSERRFEEAITTCQHTIGVAETEGLDSVASLARIALAQAQLALNQLEEALRIARGVVSTHGIRRGNLVMPALACMANAFLQMNDAGGARQAIAELLTASRSRDWEWFGLYSDLYARLAQAEGRTAAAARLRSEVDRLGREEVCALTLSPSRNLL